MAQGPASFRSVRAGGLADWGHGENTGPALGPRRAMLGPSVTGVRPWLDRAPLGPSVSLPVERGVGLGGPEAPASGACGRMDHTWSHVYCPECGCGSGRKGTLSPDAAPGSLERGWGTDRPVPSLGGSSTAFTGVCGATQAVLFLTVWDREFSLDTILPGSEEMETGLPPGRRLGVGGKRGALWNSLVRLEGAGEATVLLLSQQRPLVQTEAGARGRKEGEASGGRDGAERWREVSRPRFVFKTGTCVPVAIR